MRTGAGDTAAKTERQVPRLLATLIFASRWVQLPMYLGLIVAMLMYVVQFGHELWRGVRAIFIFWDLNETELMLSVLSMIDMVMIVNLIAMVVIGGYETFVSKLRVQDHPDEPDWLKHTNANVLKVKFATSIVVISLVHLLYMFVLVSEMDNEKVLSDTGKVIYTPEGLRWDLLIHLVFIVTAVALAFIDWLGKKGNGGAAHQLSSAQYPAGAVAGQQSAEAPVAGENAAAPAAGRLVTVQLPADAPLPPGARIIGE